jgi:predicted ester cyclase
MIMSIELNEKQKEALKYFKENLDEWVKNPLFRHKYGVIRENELAGIFDTFEAAAQEAFSKYPQVDFVIQQIISPDEIASFYFPAMARAV